MDIEQSNEPRMSGRGDGGVLVRVERRRNWSDEEKLAILKETTAPGRSSRPWLGGTALEQASFIPGASNCSAEPWQASRLSNWHRRRRRPKLGKLGGSRFEGGAA